MTPLAWKIIIGSAILALLCSFSFYKGYDYKKMEFEAALSKQLKDSQEEASLIAKNQNKRNLEFAKKLSEKQQASNALQEKLNRLLISDSYKSDPACNDPDEVHEALNAIIQSAMRSK